MLETEPLTLEHLSIHLWGSGAVPAIVFHGGPGSGHNKRHTAYFDANHHRVVLFDQRGTGNSGDAGAIVANTLQHTLRDAEMIRTALGFDNWIVVGGSWGGALALAYAEAYPSRVRSLVVRSTLISSDDQERWLFDERPRCFEAGQIAKDFFHAQLDAEEQQRPVAAWFARMEACEDLAVDAARRVIALEAAFHGAQPGRVDLAPQIGPADLARSRIYLWYWLNQFFLPGHWPASPKSIANLPHRLIHCENDLICPVEPVRDFAQQANLSLELLTGAGHDGLSPTMISAVRDAIIDLDRQRN